MKISPNSPAGLFEIKLNSPSGIFYFKRFNSHFEKKIIFNKIVHTFRLERRKTLINVGYPTVSQSENFFFFFCSHNPQIYEKFQNPICYLSLLPLMYITETEVKSEQRNQNRGNFWYSTLKQENCVGLKLDFFPSFICLKRVLF